MKLNTKIKIALYILIGYLGLNVDALAHEESDSHADHHEAHKTTVTMVDYMLPDIKLVREDGSSISLADELSDGRPVILNFIYTTCKAVCPVSSQTFSKLQSKLGRDANKVHMVSISIDPEQDTPARLVKYAQEFKAGPQWNFYTGTTEASLAAQRSFGVYYGDKMNHTPVTLLHTASSKSWLRIDGFASADELFREYNTLVSIP